MLKKPKPIKLRLDENLRVIAEEDRLYYQPEESRKEKRMNTEHVQHLLRKLGESALDLAEKIRDEGRPLNSKEKHILKMAKFGYLQEALQESAVFWFLDNHDDFLHSLENMIRDFTD